ncbi:MAG: SUMF1/EgtB/PvdO family nonheme iron enzyme, partial [Planctomycetes bacterium]|nr:SUMF1/EgtB/PvdO family nonheme iron enzyme [Planctomycetota bacterium]
FTAVGQAAPLPATAGAEVRTWLSARSAEARAEAQLGSAAVASLLGAFANWQVERGKVGGDKTRLAELGSRLATIEAGRLKLYDLLPGQRARLDRDLPTATLLRAREQLTEKPSKPIGDVDAAARLNEIRAEFVANGPLKTLRTQVDAIVPIKVEDERAQRELVLEIDEAFQIEDKIRKLTFPTSPRPPFADVADYYAQIDLALEPLVDADGGLPAWAARLRTEQRREQRLRDQVVRACGQMWSDWQVLAAGNPSMRELKAGRDAIVEALGRAGGLFPGDETSRALVAAVPITALDAALAAAEAKILRAELETGISEINDRLLDVGSLRDWGEKRAGLDKETRALRERLATIADPGDLEAQLRRIEEGCAKWRRAEQSLAKAAQDFGGGELTRCTATISVAQGAGNEGRVEFGQLQTIVDNCRSAFEVLADTLDIAAARQKLDMAAGVLATTTSMPPAVGTQLQSWQGGLRQLESAASGMIVIAGADGVDAFFLAPTETSLDEFRAFQRELNAAATGDDDAARLGTVLPRLSGVQMSAQQFGELLRWEPVGDGQDPVEQVRWFEAHAFCRWYGKSLPTKREWLLAAFGPGREHTYSWGDEWSDDKVSRNTVFRQPAKVTDGGISWRASNLHHLSDNVAEWLAETNAGRGEAAGGSCYRRRGATARQYCSGDRFDELSVSERRNGIGFRAVLRPKDYSRLVWPR